MKLGLLLVVTLAGVLTQGQEPKFFQVQFQSGSSIPEAIHVYCSQSYNRDECVRDATALRMALASYPLNELGSSWSYYLMLPFEWKPVAVSHGGDGISPAFSMLLGRATVLDRSLFFATADRKIELEKWSGIPWGPPLVAVAVSHELGHALCQEKNERLANEYGRQLREGITHPCSNRGTAQGRRTSSANKSTVVPSRMARSDPSGAMPIQE